MNLPNVIYTRSVLVTAAALCGVLLVQGVYIGPQAAVFAELFPTADAGLSRRDWARPRLAVADSNIQTMEYRKLGSLNVSLVGLGCNNFGWRTDTAGTAAVLDVALESGSNFFDTRNVYCRGQSEEVRCNTCKCLREQAIWRTKY